MESRAQDYYDIPPELLPTPNFANRPASEISMLDGMADGLWTFVLSSSSSDDDDNEEYGPRPRPRSPTSPAQSSQRQLEIPERPKITITAPSEGGLQPRSRSLSNDKKSMDRPQLRKKAQTAPPGALYSPKFVPPQPRRAISTRMGRSNTAKGRVPYQNRVTGSSLGIKRALSDGTGQPQEQPPQVGWMPENENTSQTIEEGAQSTSFSRKDRVKKTLKKKQIGMLNTDIVCFETKKLSNSPNSMLSTPRELYAIPEQKATNQLLLSPRLRRRRSIVSISPRTRSPSALANTKSRGELVGQVSKDMVPAEERRVYLPGPICLEEHPAKPRRDSVASMDPFDPAREAKANRFSDMVALDGIVMFFEDLGVVEEAIEETLDKFWLDESRKNPELADAKRPSVTSVEEMISISKSLRKGRSPRGSKFSFSSASSTASVPQPGTPKRQRIRLRRLLSPAPPSSAFLKGPASWGQQVQNP